MVMDVVGCGCSCWSYFNGRQTDLLVFGKVPLAANLHPVLEVCQLFSQYLVKCWNNIDSRVFSGCIQLQTSSTSNSNS